MNIIHGHLLPNNSQLFSICSLIIRAGVCGGFRYQYQQHFKQITTRLPNYPYHVQVGVPRNILQKLY